MNADQLGRIPDFLDENYLKTGKMPGFSVLVSQGGDVQHRSDQAYSKDSIFRIYSMTKPVTSIALLQLYEQGLVHLNDPVSKFIPSWKNLRVFGAGSSLNYTTVGLEREPTVQDLLTHTAGISYDWMYQHPVDAIYRRKGIASLSRGGNDLAAMCDALAEAPLLFQPGTRWNYSLATDVVGRLIEVISGRSLDVYFQQEILDPLGMADTGFWVSDDKADRFTQNFAQPSLSPFGLPEGADVDALMVPIDSGGPDSGFRSKPGFLSGGGGLTSTMDDYHTFCKMLLNGGTLDGVRIIGRKTLEYATSNHLPNGADLAKMGQSAFGESTFAGMGFGLGFSVTLSPSDTRVIGSAGSYAWGGAASTLFWIDPEEDLIVIGMTQLMPSSAYPIRDQIRQMVYASL